MVSAIKMLALLILFVTEFHPPTLSSPCRILYFVSLLILLLNPLCYIARMPLLWSVWDPMGMGSQDRPVFLEKLRVFSWPHEILHIQKHRHYNLPQKKGLSPPKFID